ncbi:MAG: hypothetical protein H0X31_03900 [Nostocaceae cyanobacterium]|nr:hypothetical protein [Nostocaceae cyanobacterium]
MGEPLPLYLTQGFPALEKVTTGLYGTSETLNTVSFLNCRDNCWFATEGKKMSPIIPNSGICR